ncbi:MAG: hypothetical protein U0075_13575 [Thermomicrobiales bacterium]
MRAARRDRLFRRVGVRDCHHGVILCWQIGEERLQEVLGKAGTCRWRIIQSPDLVHRGGELQVADLLLPRRAATGPRVKQLVQAISRVLSHA